MYMPFSHVVESLKKAVKRSGQDVKKGKAAEKGKAVTPHCTVFYGDAGRGFGTRIKGHIKRSTERLQLHSKSKCDLISTSEYLSSKLCCLCDSPVQYPKRRNGHINLGVVQYINPDCFGRKHGFSLRGHDKNAAVNILKIGLYRAVIQNNYPAFSATTSSTTTTADQLAQILFGHNTSWIANMNDSNPRRRTGLF
ncbi:hypothetical protein BC941DRAFT_519276 [Chlamydoabsidia padenii]|nr:hypothetical protein BC941DRAFT_519276 [Chlamydoabsidia padenii]